MADLRHSGNERPEPSVNRARPSLPDSALIELVAAEIIPRLSEASVQMTGARLRDHSPSAVSKEVELLCEIAGFGRPHDMDGFVAAVLQQESGGEAVLHLLEATARRLGQLWLEDEIDFATVTIGVCRLQGALRRFSEAHAQRFDQSANAGSVLLAACPGDQHDFGVLLVSEFLRRAGVSVSLKPAATQKDLLRAVADESFQIAGLSLSREALIPQLETLIASIRQKSRNPGIVIMVGGRVFLDRPELVDTVGADLLVVDGQDAVRQVRKIVPQVYFAETRDE